MGCENENDGSISVDITGGTSPYSIEIYNNLTNLEISNSNGQELFGELARSSYNLIVTDLNNCTYEDSFQNRKSNFKFNF